MVTVDQLAPPLVERKSMLMRLPSPPAPSFMPAMNTVPSGPVVVWTLRMKPPACT